MSDLEEHINALLAHRDLRKAERRAAAGTLQELVEFMDELKATRDRLTDVFVEKARIASGEAEHGGLDHPISKEKQ